MNESYDGIIIVINIAIFIALLYISGIIYYKRRRREKEEEEKEKEYTIVERKTVDFVIKQLLENSSNFTTRWGIEKSIKESVRNKDGSILVMAHGRILSPVRVIPNKKDKEIIVEAIGKILDKDYEEILKTFV